MRMRQAITAATLLVLPVTVLTATAGPASADVERRGACGSGSYEFSVDREGRRYEVSVDLDRLGPGTRWRIVLRHNGKRIARVVRVADREGDAELDRSVRNRSGRDSFRFKAKRLGGSQACGARLRVP